MRIIAFLVLLITPLLVLAGPEDPEITELQLGNPHRLTMYQDWKFYYQYIIPENFVSDLLIGTYLERYDIFGCGIVYVSFEDQYPNSTNSSYLSKPLNQTIVLRNDDLKGMKNVYIGVTCTSITCSLYLDIDMPKEPHQSLQLIELPFSPIIYDICQLLSIVGCTLNLIVACVLEKTRKGPLGEMTIHYIGAEFGFFLFFYLAVGAILIFPPTSTVIVQLISLATACLVISQLWPCCFAHFLYHQGKGSYQEHWLSSYKRPLFLAMQLATFLLGFFEASFRSISDQNFFSSEAAGSVSSLSMRASNSVIFSALSFSKWNSTIP